MIKMKNRLIFSSLVAGMLLFPLAMAPDVSAFSCGGVQTSIDFGSSSSLCTAKGASPITALILWAIGFLAVGVGVAVVIGIAFGGIMYAASDGDATKAKQGRDIIMNAIIGLLLFIFMYAAVNFFVPGGVFKP